MKIRLTNNIEEANCITHAGIFHADEVFATVLFSKLLPQVILCRVSELKEPIKEKYVYDIGGGELDHHQIGGNGKREDGTLYASVGLVWKKYGKQILEKSNLSTEELEGVMKIIDRDFIECIDANDNGQFLKLDINYSYVSVASIISSFNSAWNEEVEQDACFLEAFSVASKIFDRFFKRAIAKVKAKKIIEEKIETSQDGILILEHALPWKEALLTSKNPKAKNIKFVIFPSIRGGYNAQAVPKEIGSLESRKLFPASWAGLKEELQQETEIQTAIFCHNGRFICGAKTLEDTISLVKLAFKES